MQNPSAVAVPQIMRKVFTTFNAPDGALMVVVTPKDLGFVEPTKPADILSEKFLNQWSEDNLENYILEMYEDKHNLWSHTVRDIIVKIFPDRGGWSNFGTVWFNLYPCRIYLYREDSPIGFSRHYVTWSGQGGLMASDDSPFEIDHLLIFRLRERKPWAKLVLAN